MIYVKDFYLACIYFNASSVSAEISYNNVSST